MWRSRQVGVGQTARAGWSSWHHRAKSGSAEAPQSIEVGRAKSLGRPSRSKLTARGGSRHAPGNLRSTQNRSGDAPGMPRGAQGRSRSVSGSSRGVPGAPRERLKCLQRHHRTPKRAPGNARERAEATQIDAKSHPGAKKQSFSCAARSRSIVGATRHRFSSIFGFVA